MVISHRHRFIFIKTTKVGGTSLEHMLDGLCGDEDVLTPHKHEVEGYRPRNWEGPFDVMPELRHIYRHEGQLHEGFRGWLRQQVKDRERFHEGIPAWQVRHRVASSIWNDYFKFTIERNPWDKAISRYYHSKSIYEPKYGRELTMDDWLDYFEQRLAQPWVTKSWGSEAPYNFPRYADSWTEELLVDRVLRYEDLDNELGAVFEQLGVNWPGQIPRTAKTGYRTDRRPYQEVLSDSQRERIAKACAKEIALMGYTF